MFNFVSTAAQLGRVVSYEQAGIPPDFLTRFFEGLKRVTPKVRRDAGACLLTIYLHVSVFFSRSKSSRPQGAMCPSQEPRRSW